MMDYLVLPEFTLLVVTGQDDPGFAFASAEYWHWRQSRPFPELWPQAMHWYQTPARVLSFS